MISFMDIICQHVTVSTDTSICTAQKLADGTFELEYLQPGKNVITIHYQGEESAFNMECVN